VTSAWVRRESNCFRAAPSASAPNSIVLEGIVQAKVSPALTFVGHLPAVASDLGTSFDELNTWSRNLFAWNQNSSGSFVYNGSLCCVFGAFFPFPFSAGKKVFALAKGLQLIVASDGKRRGCCCIGDSPGSSLGRLTEVNVRMDAQCRLS
jgi:hypothetical protein